MTDRLKQIWGDFASRTSVHLTNVDIDGVSRPLREERIQRQDKPQMTLDAGREDASKAVEAAFTALHADIMNKAKRSSRRRGQDFSAEAEAPITAPAGLDDRILQDLKATEALTRRSMSDYLGHAREQQALWKKQKRKKFLGIF